MNRNIVLGKVAVLLCFISFSQNEVLEIPIQYKGFSYKNKEALAISNEKTGELMLLIEDTDKTKVILLNPQMKIVSEFEFESLPSSFKKFIGHQINSDGSFSILFTNNSNKKFGLLKLDFEKKMSFRATLDFKLKNEVYVESVSHKNKYYLISTTKSSNNVNFYEYNDGHFSKKATHSFEFFETKSSNEYGEFWKFDAFEDGVVKIDNTIPNGIEITSEPSKLYILDNNFVFIFDGDENETQVATISIDSYEMDLDAFSKPEIDSNNFLKNHNSFLYDNKIFQIKATPDLLKFVVKDFESKTVLKEVVLKKEDSIGTVKAHSLQS